MEINGKDEGEWPLGAKTDRSQETEFGNQPD